MHKFVCFVLYAFFDYLLTHARPCCIEHQRKQTQRRCGITTLLLTFSVRFMLDGENINPESTPADMDLEDDDQIDCFLAQVGGRVLA
jgi:hypothetical protein